MSGPTLDSAIIPSSPKLAILRLLPNPSIRTPPPSTFHLLSNSYPLPLLLLAPLTYFSEGSRWRRAVLNVAKVDFKQSFLHGCLFRLAKYLFLNYSRDLADRLLLFLSTDALHYVEFHQYSVKWSCLPGRECVSSLGEQAQPLLYPIPPSPFLTHKARVIQLHHKQNMQTQRTSTAWRSTVLPDGPNPPPFIRGALSHQRRDIFCTCMQLSAHHGFHAGYSERFRQGADGSVTCPRGRPHTLNHVLLHCRLHNLLRRCIFGQHANSDYIFGTEDGGKKLGDFLLATNDLRRPLPPRPDPP